MMIRTADLLAEASRIPEMAGTAIVRPDWAPVAARIRDEVTDNWDYTVAVERFEGKGGRFLRGRERLTACDVVTVDDRHFRATWAVVLGSRLHPPAIPPIAGLTDTPYWTNHDTIEAKKLPGSITVLGGGAIGSDQRDEIPGPATDHHRLLKGVRYRMRATV